jgi:hypothetical protein
MNRCLSFTIGPGYDVVGCWSIFFVSSQPKFSNRLSTAGVKIFLFVCLRWTGVAATYIFFQGSNISPDAAFELVDVLIANAQNVVHVICESITCRVSGTSEKSKRQAINPNLCVVFSYPL